MNSNQLNRVRWLQKSVSGRLLTVLFLAGCSAKSQPVSIAATERDGIKQNLVSLGARVTSDSEEALYLSLRNTFIEVHPTGGMIEGSYKTQQDARDFAGANAAIAKVFLDTEDCQQFNKWLLVSMKTGSRAPQQADHKRLKVTLSRVPLQVVFSLNQQTELN